MKNFTSKIEQQAYSFEEQVMTSYLHGKASNLPYKATVKIEKQPLIPFGDSVFDLGFEIYPNDVTGSHWINDEINECVIGLILGNEGKGETDFSAFQKKAFVYGFVGRSETIDFIVNKLKLETVEGGQI